MPIFILFPGYGDGPENWPAKFLASLKKLGDVILPPSIVKKKKVSIVQYCARLKVPEYAKYAQVILIGHSIGVWFAVEYAKLHKVDCIISLDGSLVGPYIRSAMIRVLKKPDAPSLLINLLRQAPLKMTKFPVNTFCFRNMYMSADASEKEIDHNKNALNEANVIKNYKVYFASNVGHYVHEHEKTARAILRCIRNRI